MARSLDGRTFEIDLVRGLMLRPEGAGHPAGDRQPVVVFEGGAATGKTALLNALASRCLGRVPYAYLDLENAEAELGDAAIPKLLAALAFQLARRCKLYGSLRFDRLVIGLLTMQLELNQVDQAQARFQVTEMLKDRRGLTTLKRILSDVAQAAPNLVPFVPGSGILTTIAELSVDALVSWLPTRRRLLGRFQDWYGHQDRDLGLDSIDELVDLNWSLRHHNWAGGRGGADELLWSAFLADLRDNFRTGRRADEWSLNCLLLLDNADTPLGRTFLHRLVQVHEYPLVGGVGIQDPVTVVATSRGGLLTTLTKAEKETVREVVVAGDIGPQRYPGGPGRASWLRRPLPALTVDEVHEMVKKMMKKRPLPEGNTRNLATLLHQLGGGHLGGTRMLLTAVAGERTTLVEPEDLLRSGQPGVTLEEELYDRLLAGVPEDALDAVITCSAGRHPAEGRRLLTWNGCPDQAELALLPAGMWEPEPGARTTLLRLLLLRRLARRPWTHRWNWSAVHDTLRAACPADDPAGELHHTLADEKVDEVVQALTRRLDEDPLPHWLALLHTVTTAPRRPGEPAAAGTGDEERPAGSTGADDGIAGLDDGVGTEPPAFVRSLVTALWTVADPVCGSNRSGLYRRIARGYRDLSWHTGDRSEDLFELIQRYEQLARQWRRGANRRHEGVRVRT